MDQKAVQIMGDWNRFAGWDWLLDALVVALVLRGLFFLAPRPFEYIWDLGYDRRRRLLVVLRLSKFLLVAAGLVYLFTVIFQDSPFLAYLGLALVGGIGLLSQKDTLGNFLGGIILLFQKNIHLGNRVRIGAVSGHIVAIDLLTLRLKSDAGDEVMLPHGQVLKEVVEVSSDSTGSPVEMEFLQDDGNGITSDLITQLIITSPYRKAKTRFEVAQKNFEMPRKITATFYVWSHEVVTDARNHFYASLARHLKQGGG